VLHEKNKMKYKENKLLDSFPFDYKEIPDFETLEKEYYKIVGKETETIKKYIEKNIHQFCVVV
jgi:hypothetical protein